jgi:hypothetical protein
MKSSVAAVLLLAVAGMQLAAGESFRAASQQYPITERLQGSPRSSVQQPVATSSWYKA